MFLKSNFASTWILYQGSLCQKLRTIDYRCADKKKVGELRGDIGAIR